jgi:hypothetical protein
MAKTQPLADRHPGAGQQRDQEPLPQMIAGNQHGDDLLPQTASGTSTAPQIATIRQIC